MSDRFSSEELYKLRNSIPINTLIEKLKVECRNSDGYLRFQCPVCGGWHTATKEKTNLARCFSCQRNFNPIDLAMICKNRSFIDSVRFLKRMTNEVA